MTPGSLDRSQELFFDFRFDGEKFISLSPVESRLVAPANVGFSSLSFMNPL